jgi:hypothetical protein
LPEAVSVTVHDTFHLLGVFQCSELFWVCSNVPSCKPGTLRTVPVQINFADGTKAAIRRGEARSPIALEDAIDVASRGAKLTHEVGPIRHEPADADKIAEGVRRRAACSGPPMW